MYQMQFLGLVAIEIYIKHKKKKKKKKNLTN